VITVLAMVGAAILLIAVGSLFKGFPRRVSTSSPVERPTGGQLEVDESERAALEKIIREGAGR
jgi:hypothetical protein